MSAMPVFVLESIELLVELRNLYVQPPNSGRIGQGLLD